MKNKISILHLEDQSADSILVKSLISKEFSSFDYYLVDNEKDFLLALKEKKIDIILSDFQLPGYSGSEALIVAKNQYPHIPFIYVTGKLGEDNAIESLLNGARDYVLKPKLKRLATAIKRVIYEDKLLHDRIVSDKALRDSEDIYRMLIDTTHESVVIAQDGLIKFANTLTLGLLGYSEQEIIDKPFHQFIHPDDRSMVVENYKKRIANAAIQPRYSFRVVTRDGMARWVEINAALFEWHGKPATLSFLNDFTQRKQAEDALKESEELFRSLIYNSSDLTLLTNEKGITTFCSPQCERVIGYPCEKFIGQMMPDIIHPDDEEKCRKAWHQVLHEGLEIREFEYRIVDNEEKVRCLSHTANLIKSGDKILGIQNTIRNITERKISEQALKVSEEKYKTMLNASPDGIFLVNMKGIITEVSEIGLELLGADTRNDLVGKNIFQFVPSDEKLIIKEIIEKALNEGLAQNIGVKIRKKNKSLFSGEISATLIQGEGGAPLSFMIIIRDISQRKKIETKQIHADRMANLGEMASGIAHEINQPLNIISMVMDKILFEFTKTETIEIEFLKNKSNKIFENITRMRNIIDHIRAFSRTDDDFVLTPFDINSSIENATSMIMEQFKYLGINLSLQLEKQIPQIFGNTYKFEQVILNLLVNAKDAVIERKSKQEEYFEMIIGIRSYQENQFLIVEVTDNGIGISNDDINNIILPFYTTKDEGKGTGLGLSICYQIIKQMDGTIDITSDRIHGTKIKLILDIQKKK